MQGALAGSTPQRQRPLAARELGFDEPAPEEGTPPAPSLLSPERVVELGLLATSTGLQLPAVAAAASHVLATRLTGATPESLVEVQGLWDMSGGTDQPLGPGSGGPGPDGEQVWTHPSFTLGVTPEEMSASWWEVCRANQGGQLGSRMVVSWQLAKVVEKFLGGGRRPNYWRP